MSSVKWRWKHGKLQTFLTSHLHITLNDSSTYKLPPFHTPNLPSYAPSAWYCLEQDPHLSLLLPPDPSHFRCKGSFLQYRRDMHSILKPN